MPAHPEALRLAIEAKDIYNNARAEARDMSPEERGQVEQMLTKADQLNRSYGVVPDQIADMGYASGGVRADASFSFAPSGLGDQFISSKGYRDLFEGGAQRPQQWSTGAIELQTKGTLVTTPGTALTPAGYAPGVVEILTQQNYVADLMSQLSAPGNPVRYVQESVATNAAAPTSETAAKPESTITFTEVSEPVRKIATFLPVSDEFLEDAPQIQAYLNSRLSLFVQNVEEAQLLTGNGTAPNLQGFLVGRGIGTYVRNVGTTNERALLTAASGCRGSSFLAPDCVILNPVNYLSIRAGTDTTGQYLAGGPLIGAYGGPSGPANAFGIGERLWGMRLVVTSNIGAGTALLGSFSQAAAVYRKDGLTVEASNSHSDFFQRNQVAIRAEERLALAVFRPSAFVCVTGLA